jgi:hypothetical protein
MFEQSSSILEKTYIEKKETQVVTLTIAHGQEGYQHLPNLPMFNFL